MTLDSTRRRIARLRCVLTLCAVWSPAFAQADRPPAVHSESAVKAAYVLRFIGYVEWPKQPASDHTMDIAVLGDNDVAVQLERLAAVRQAQGQALQVRRIARIQDAGNAQILYVGSSRRGELRNLLASIGDRSVLVITNETQALKSGSTINLLVADQRVRFEVSLEAARLARLRISSELLSLAVRVHGARRGDAAGRSDEPAYAADFCCAVRTAAVPP